MTITIYHPEHGEAHCDEAQLKAMESEGWSKDKPEPAKPADGKKKP